MKKIVVFGPGPQFKGGIANYNTSLAKAFDKMPGTEVYIISWTQQYPAIIPRDFIDRKSKFDQLEGTNIKIQYVTNYNNPFSWKKTVQVIRGINPDFVVFQWSIAIQGIPLGYISKRLQKKTSIEVIFDLHFVDQKEGSSIDELFTKYGIKHANTYVVHSLKTYNELETLLPDRKFKVVDKREALTSKHTHVIKLFHPVYDMFTPDTDFAREDFKTTYNLRENVFLFFGFIRKYKGLHNVIKAFAKATEGRNDMSLLIVGEAFWQTLDTRKFSTKLKKTLFGFAKKILLNKQDSEDNYHPLDLIAELGIMDKVTSVIEFIPNEDVNKYFQVSDAIMLYYSTATPSGVESIAYNFRLPMLATRVGHFPETIKDGYNGYLADPEDIDSMAKAMLKIIDKPINRENISETSREMSWHNYASAIIG